MDADPARAGRVRALDALRGRNFRLLWTGQTISLLGDGAFFVALGWRVYTLEGSARPVGYVLLAYSVGLLATVLVGGALADRYDRKWLMIGSDIARFAAIGVLAVADASGALSVPFAFVMALVAGLATGFFQPAFGGIVPLVVDAHMLPSANSLIGVSRWASLMLGPGVVGLAYDAAGSATVFAGNACSFLVAAGLLAFARPRRVAREAKESTVAGIVTGARYVAGVPWLWVTIGLFSVVLMIQLAPQQVLMPKLVEQHFDRGVGAYGLLTSLVGVGTVAGTLAFGQWPLRRRRGVVSYVIWILNSTAIAALVLSPWIELAAFFAVFRGFCLGYGVAMWETMLMQLVPESLLSRVISLDWFGSFGLMPVGLVVAALISELASPSAIIAAGATVSAVMFACALPARWLRAVD